MRKILIIIPAYNESENIIELVDNLEQNYSEYDYVIVNDGSRDNTLEICLEHGYEVLDLPCNMGIGGAVQTGYKYALANGYDLAVQMDGDGQHDPAFLRDMVNMLDKQGVDAVIGSRFVGKDSKGFKSSGTRRAGIKILSILAKILTGVRIYDITSGYRLVNKKLIEIYAEDYPADYPEPEAMIMACVWGCAITEYPVVMKEREGGMSSITLKKSVYYMIKVSLAMIIRRLSLGFRRA